MAPLEAIVWKDGSLKILDQLLLPGETTYIDTNSVNMGWQVINKMQVRGAPAIAIVGCLSLAAELHHNSTDSVTASYCDCTSLHAFVRERLEYLVTARPTAVNMRREATRLQDFTRELAADESLALPQMVNSLIKWCSDLLSEDINTNKSLGDHGMKYILNKKGDTNSVTMMTICNTGALATAGYGTALGVVRSLHSANRLGGVYILETRPYLQGARLTALEAVVEQWPNATLVCDGAVGALLSSVTVDGAVVGADRVAANGDTANKIGTYQLAVLCQHHSVPFYVCTPVSSVDLSLESGASIPIEHRPEHEMAEIAGKRVAAPGIKCWNPAFDVTPARLITGGIITELGVFPPDQLKAAITQHKHQQKC